MSKITRRTFTKLAGAAGATSALGLVNIVPARAASGRVIVVGGGFGGATTAKYIRKMDPGIQVTLIEPKRQFVTCPFSNTVIGGMHDIGFITHNYDALKGKWGATVLHDMVTAVDTAKKTVRTAGGSTLRYDKLVLSPGIDFKWNAVAGYSQAASQIIPHAWNGGPQTLLLRKQLEAMSNGGVFIIVPPPNPFRCPPGPYERVSLIAHYFKTRKPKSKIIILDPKAKFSKMPLFVEGWKALYGDMIKWVGQKDGGGPSRVDVAGMTVHTQFDEFKGDVINFVPAQKAGKIAHIAGAANKSGWCPIDPRTFESKLVKDVYVVGDAAIASPLPKSGFAANAEGKACALAIIASLSGKTPGEPSFINTCYSLVSPDYGISVAMVYGFAGGKITKIKGSGGVSPKGASADFRRKEAQYASGWYSSISSDIWG
jgi:sulfide dehydrogenase [flavocytochrome c] flavoprotein subunit